MTSSMSFGSLKPANGIRLPLTLACATGAGNRSWPLRRARGVSERVIVLACSRKDIPIGAATRGVR